MHRSIQETYHVIPSTAFSKLSYVLQHSTHGVTEADGGKKISLEYLTEVHNAMFMAENLESQTV